MNASGTHTNNGKMISSDSIPNCVNCIKMKSPSLISELPSNPLSPLSVYKIFDNLHSYTTLPASNCLDIVDTVSTIDETPFVSFSQPQAVSYITDSPLLRIYHKLRFSDSFLLKYTCIRDTSSSSQQTSSSHLLYSSSLLYFAYDRHSVFLSIPVHPISDQIFLSMVSLIDSLNNNPYPTQQYFPTHTMDLPPFQMLLPSYRLW